MPGEAAPTLARLTAGGPGAPRLLLLAAHPDDETIGAAALLARLPLAHVAFATHGAPRDRRWWGDPAAPDRAAYAAARAAEADAALAVLGVSPDRAHRLGYVDQEASLDLAALADDVAALLRRLRPDVLLTHPYEGGHPDHDACAFAAARACARLAREGAAAPLRAEFASYHADGAGMATGRFLPPGDGTEMGETEIRLSPAERARKAEAFARYVTQVQVLTSFGTEVERFRQAPEHDFTRPPHGGPLHYERFDWGTTGAAWRARAAAVPPLP